MKLFQIEEPDGAPATDDGPGAVVGMDLAEASGAVAIAVGGNAEILPDGDGARRLAARWTGDGGVDAAAAADVLRHLRGRAEKQLQRPVTHVVIATARHDEEARRALEAAAAAAGLTVLRLLARAAAAALVPGAVAEDAPVLGAAVAAEDLAPPDGIA